MEPIRIHTTVESETLHLPVPGEFIGKRVEVVIRETPRTGPALRRKPRVSKVEGSKGSSRTASSHKKGKRPLGLYRDKIWISSDFDAPLDPETRAAFEGEGEDLWNP